MMLKLSDEQRQALESHPKTPLPVEDPQSKTKYILITLEQFEQMKRVIDAGHPAGSSLVGSDEPDDADSPELPDWCNVYAGLTDAQVEDLEKIILQRSNLTRET